MESQLVFNEKKEQKNNRKEYLAASGKQLLQGSCHFKGFFGMKRFRSPFSA